MIGDLPFGSYEISDEQAIATALRMVKEAGCEVVKLEGGGASSVSRARAIIGAGIPVMGHVGLTPQQALSADGFRVHGRTAESAREIIDGARSLSAAGCFAVVAEAVPSSVAKELTARVEVPIIGIGAGGATDGQVLVFHDLVGLYDEHTPRFVKRYASLKPEMIDALTRYAADVRARRFPRAEHEYGMDAEELSRLKRMID
jgi:3-methyl-2-oxobutanoate hydroxymethyltransferase